MISREDKVLSYMIASTSHVMFISADRETSPTNIGRSAAEILAAPAKAFCAAPAAGNGLI
jgi:hypothetical protein